jgi:hypothetical protein
MRPGTNALTRPRLHLHLVESVIQPVFHIVSDIVSVSGICERIVPLVVMVFLFTTSCVDRGADPFSCNDVKIMARIHQSFIGVSVQSRRGTV